MGDEGDAADDQLGPRRLDERRRRPRRVERDAVVGARALAVLDLGLGDRRRKSTSHSVGASAAVRLAAGEVAEERRLADAPARRRRSSCTAATSRPTARAGGSTSSNTCSSVAVSSWHSSTKLGREIGTLLGALRDVAAVRRRELRVVRQRRVAPDAVEVLHPALGGQAVVVPADREEDLLARASAGSGPWRRTACSRRSCPCAATPTPWAAACRRRTPRRVSAVRSKRYSPVGVPAPRPSALRCRRASASRGLRPSRKG